jgi:hypothetical protein
MPLLLTLDPNKKYDCCFTYDAEKQAWQIRFEEREQKDGEQKDESGDAQGGDE